MKTAAVIRRALKLCAPLLFSLTIMLSAGTIAQAQGDASAVPELERAYNGVQEATMAMKQAEAQNNTRAMERARNNYNKANQNMAQNLARVSGVRTEDVTGMQRAGMDWGQVAQELGLEPAHLGIGKQGSQTTTPDRDRAETVIGTETSPSRILQSLTAHVIVIETEIVTGIETSPSRIPPSRNAPGRGKEPEKDWARRLLRSKGSW